MAYKDVHKEIGNFRRQHIFRDFNRRVSEADIGHIHDFIAFVRRFFKHPVERHIFLDNAPVV